MKRRFFWIIGGMLICAVLGMFIYKYDAIFQRGNPLPYQISAIQISEEHPYIKVNDGAGIYIAKRGQCPELMDYVQEATGMEYLEQAGSGYLFSDGNENLTVSSEVYWGKYTVWSIPIG